MRKITITILLIIFSLTLAACNDEIDLSDANWVLLEKEDYLEIIEKFNKDLFIIDNTYDFNIDYTFDATDNNDIVNLESRMKMSEDILKRDLSFEINKNDDQFSFYNKKGFFYTNVNGLQEKSHNKINDQVIYNKYGINFESFMDQMNDNNLINQKHKTISNEFFDKITLYKNEKGNNIYKVAYNYNDLEIKNLLEKALNKIIELPNLDNIINDVNVKKSIFEAVYIDDNFFSFNSKLEVNEEVFGDLKFSLELNKTNLKVSYPKDIKSYPDKLTPDYLTEFIIDGNVAPIYTNLALEELNNGFYKPGYIFEGMFLDEDYTIETTFDDEYNEVEDEKHKYHKVIYLKYVKKVDFDEMINILLEAKSYKITNETTSEVYEKTEDYFIHFKSSITSLHDIETNKVYGYDGFNEPRLYNDLTEYIIVPNSPLIDIINSIDLASLVLLDGEFVYINEEGIIEISISLEKILYDNQTYKIEQLNQFDYTLPKKQEIENNINNAIIQEITDFFFTKPEIELTLDNLLKSLLVNLVFVDDSMFTTSLGTLNPVIFKVDLPETTGNGNVLITHLITGETESINISLKNKVK